jgi:hypothetical protein
MFKSRIDSSIASALSLVELGYEQKNLEYRVYGFEELFQWQRVTLRGNNKKAAVRSGFG